MAAPRLLGSLEVDITGIAPKRIGGTIEGAHVIAARAWPLDRRFGLRPGRAAPVACSPPPVATEVDPDREAGADYWTPERMRSARPVETHPDGPIEDEDVPLACPTESRTAPGRPGAGEIVPDEGNDPGRIDPRSSE